MQKAAIILVTMLILILASHSQAETNGADAAPQQKTQGKLIRNPNKPEPNSTNSSTRAATFSAAQQTISLYDVWYDLITDNDGDGYYQKLHINFDLDTAYSEYPIYVVAEIGSQSQTLFQTDPYNLNGNSASDSYQATVLLTEGYPSSYYDLVFKVYDADNHQLLAQFSSQNNDLFEPLYLEDATLDSNLEDVSLYSLAYDLSEDWDHDGYYTKINLQFDADAPNQQRWIYAELFLVDEYGQWHELASTQPFQIAHYNSQDAYQTSVSLNSGFSPQSYQVAVRIYDGYTHSLLLTTIAPSGSYADMESIDWDNDNWSEDETVIVEEEYYYASGSGGSMGLGIFVALIALGLRRKFN